MNSGTTILNAAATRSEKQHTTKTVTVLIAAHNEADSIARTLASIARQTRKPNAVIVVDDGSGDATGRIAAQNGARVIRRSQSSGKKSAAQHAALPHITTDIVVTVDADTELAPDAVEELLKPFESNTPPVGACGFVLPRDVKSVWQYGRWVEYLFGQSIDKPAQSLGNMILVASGCIAAYDVSEIRKVGGFLSRTLAEDMDLTWRLLTSGARFGKKRKRIHFVPQALAYTIDPPTFLIYRSQMRRWYAAFFQNLRIHKKALLKWKNILLTPYAAVVLFDGIAGTLLYFVLPLIALASDWAFFWMKTFFLWQLGIETIFGLTFSVFQIVRIRRREKRCVSQNLFIRFENVEKWAFVPDQRPDLSIQFLKLICAIPCFIVTSFINRCFFFWAFVREIVLNRPLPSWQKGH